MACQNDRWALATMSWGGQNRPVATSEPCRAVLRAPKGVTVEVMRIKLRQPQHFLVPSPSSLQQPGRRCVGPEGVGMGVRCGRDGRVLPKELLRPLPNDGEAVLLG